jgi:uncharacterized membrane protein YfcA
MTWQLILAGALVGTLVGMTGMGGGSLMTPLLVIVFGFQPAVAVGTDLLHGAVFKTVGALRHHRLGTVHARLSGWMLLGSAPMSLVGVAAATWLKHRYGTGADSVQGVVLGSALVAGAIGLGAKSFIRLRPPSDGLFVMTGRDRLAAVLIGLGGGFVVGLTSVGSGVFFGLTMLVVFPLRAHKIVGTDIFHAAALLYVAGFGHFVAGNVDMSTVGWLLIGSIPGVIVGSQLSLSIPERPLRMVLATVLGLSGLKLLDVPGATVAIVVVLLAGLTGLLAWIARRSWVRRQRGRAERLATQRTA